MTVNLLDPTPGHNNPLRVPVSVERAEGDPGIQAGLPRLIHVHGPLIVGTVAALQEHHMIASTNPSGNDETRTAPEDGAYVNAAGNPFQFRKGDPLPPGLTLRDDAAIAAAAPAAEPQFASAEVIGEVGEIRFDLSDEDVARIIDGVTEKVIQEVTAAIRITSYPPGYQTPEGGQSAVETPESPAPKPETVKERKDREAAEKVAADAAAAAEGQP